MDPNEQLKWFIIENVMKRRLGHLYSWEKPVVVGGVGPSHPDGFDQFEFELEAFKDAIREVYGSKTLAELEEEFDHMGTPIREGRELGEIFAMEMTQEIKQKQPHWYGCGVPIKGREADVAYWSKREAWNLDETLALSIGIEPHGRFLTNSEGAICAKDVLSFLSKRAKMVNEAFVWQVDGKIKRFPTLEICNWFEKVELEVPPDLLESVGKFYGKKFKIKNAPNVEAGLAKELSSRERASLLKLVITMALKGYGFDPTANKSSVPAEILSDANLIGLSMDISTIRKFLKEAAKLISPENTGENETK